MTESLIYDLNNRVLSDAWGRPVTLLHIIRGETLVWRIQLMDDASQDPLQGVYVEVTAKLEGVNDSAPVIANWADTDEHGVASINIGTLTQELDQLLGLNTGRDKSVIRLEAQVQAELPGGESAVRHLSLPIAVCYRNDLTHPATDPTVERAYPSSALVWQAVEGGGGTGSDLNILPNSSISKDASHNIDIKLLAAGGIARTASGDLYVLVDDIRTASSSQRGIIKAGASVTVDADGTLDVNWSEAPEASAEERGMVYTATDYGTAYPDGHVVGLGYLKAALDAFDPGGGGGSDLYVPADSSISKDDLGNINVKIAEGGALIKRADGALDVQVANDKLGGVRVPPTSALIINESTGNIDVKYNKFGGGLFQNDNNELEVRWESAVKGGRDVYGVWQIGSNGGLVKQGNYLALSPWALSAMPVGTIIAYAGAENLLGFLHCDGSSINRTAYSELSPIIDGLYGTSTGTTVRLPDFRAEFLRGWDGGRGVDSGRALGSFQGDAIRNITGSLPTVPTDQAANTYTGPFKNGGLLGTRVGVVAADGWGVVQTGMDLSRSVPTANENRPRNVAVRYLIRFRPMAYTS